MFLPFFGPCPGPGPELELELGSGGGWGKGMYRSAGFDIFGEVRRGRFGKEREGGVE